MSRSDSERLADIVAAADEVAGIVGRGRETFDGDVALQRALERCLEIIGEAAKALDPLTRESIVGVPWSDVIRLRDLLSHHYHRIETDQVWTTSAVDVPKVAEAIRSTRER